MPRKSARELEAPAPLQLVSPSLPIELPAPPNHLSAATQDWWRQIVADYDLEPHHLKILECAADAWDRLAQARATLLDEGLVIEGGSGPKAHPCVAIQPDARPAFARMGRQLD